jgi:hypothetical protein
VKDRTSIRIKPCDILDPLPMERLPTLCHFSPTAGYKPGCVKLQKIQVSITHHT